MEQALPELAAVPWRRRASDHSLDVRTRLWLATTVAHTVPFGLAAVVLVVLSPLAAPVSVAALAHAWIIPELYAQRGANVVRPRRRGSGTAERAAVGLLGDLIGAEARELHAETGLVLERGRLGVWLVGEAGALLVRPGGGTVLCFCVRASGDGLPSGDRIAHLLLALREDESGFATVANLAFAGAAWRVRRRLDRAARPALAAGRAAAGYPGRSMEQEATAKGPSFLRRVAAVIILAVAAYLLFKVVLHIILGVAWAIVAIVAIVGIIWSIRQL